MLPLKGYPAWSRRIRIETAIGMKAVSLGKSVRFHPTIRLVMQLEGESGVP